MRWWLRPLLVLPVAVGLSLVGCEKKQPSVLMLAITSEASTDQIDFVEVVVDRAGDTRLAQYRIGNGNTLPGTLPVQLDPEGDAKPGDKISITVSAQGPNDGAAKVVREFSVNFVEERTKLLPVPIRFGCFDAETNNACGFGTTCINGCGSIDIEASNLVGLLGQLCVWKKGSSSCFDPDVRLSSSDPNHFAVAPTKLLAQLFKTGSSCSISAQRHARRASPSSAHLTAPI
ncbi:MAG: hypothetical protein U0165_08530 [Polyangiaceae bacterium]